MIDREIYLRENYGIGRFVGFRLFEIATQLHFILVSSMNAKEFEKTDIHVADSVEEAIELAKKLTGKEHLSTYIMPYAANTMASTEI